MPVPDGVEVGLVVDVGGGGRGRVRPVVPVVMRVVATAAGVVALAPRCRVCVVAEGGGGAVVVVVTVVAVVVAPGHRGRRRGGGSLVLIAA